jgi:hypothetical protein
VSLVDLRGGGVDITYPLHPKSLIKTRSKLSFNLWWKNRVTGHKWGLQQYGEFQVRIHMRQTHTYTDVLTYLLTHSLTHSMVQEIIWKADYHSACQKYPASLWNPKVHHHVQNSPPPDPILSQLNPVRPIHPYLPKVQLQRISPGPRRFETFRNNKKILRWGIVGLKPKPQAGGPPLAGCPRLVIQYIRSYPRYPEDFPPSANWGRAMPWWQGTHLPWLTHARTHARTQ